MDETVLLGNDTMDVTKLTQAPVRSAEESDESEDSSVDDVVEYYRMAWGAVEVDGDAEGVVSARRLAAAVTALNAAKSPDAVDIGEQDTGAAGTAEPKEERKPDGPSSLPWSSLLSVLSLTRRTSLQQSRLAELLVRQAVRLLPQNHRDRYEEEWLAELAQVQGRFPPLMMALRILAGTRSMARVLRRQSVRSLNSTLPIRRSKATGISLTVAVTTLVGLCYFCLVNGMLNRQRATLAFLIALSLGILTFRVARRKWPSTGSNNGRVFDQRKTRTWQKAYWQLNAGVMSVNDDLRRVWQRAAGFGKPLKITVARTFDDLMLVVNYIAGSTLNTVKTHVSSAVFRNRVAQHGRPTRRTTEAEARPSPTSSWSSSRGPTATKATRR